MGGVKPTEKIQDLPAEQTHQLLLQHLLRHLALLTHHLLLLLVTTKNTTNRLPVSTQPVRGASKNSIYRIWNGDACAMNLRRVPSWCKKGLRFIDIQHKHVFVVLQLNKILAVWGELGSVFWAFGKQRELLCFLVKYIISKSLTLSIYIYINK